MTAEQSASRLAWRGVHILVALCASAAVLALLAFGYGTVPALGPALDPGHGVWTSAAGGELPRSQTLALPGLARPVSVSFTSQGVPSIRAHSARDAFLALGYVHAEFRLSEMDLARRLGEGRLAQLVGPSAVASDELELRLGLLRTAQREWADTPRSSPAAQALIAYSRGVNDYLAQARSSGQWPAVFSLAGVYPADWTPVDSLVVQSDLTQELDFTTMPLDYELLERSLGAARTMEWFPVLPPDQQSPYDPGPYANLGTAPIAPAATAARAVSAATQSVTGSATTTASVTSAGAATSPATTALPATASPVSRQLATAASAILAEMSALPVGQVYSFPDSNAWAANGPQVAGGGAMLAGDPHIAQTLPSFWYQAAISAPGLEVSGISIPGLPGILIGHNQHIAWSLTSVQNQAALFYDEQTSASRPGEYFWDGQWRRVQQLHYTIAVRGRHPVSLTVDETVHGPVLTRAGQTVSVDWMGAIGSPDLAVVLDIDQASDFAQFSAALASWHAPAMNFVYADDQGNIGAVSAGYYPQVRGGTPWLPMPGTGADDVVGVIPYAALPQVYDPPGHVIATANQRPVGPSYPYYIGTTADFFDPGYRADEEYSYLGSHTQMTAASFAALQASLTDPLAARIVPQLLTALQGAPLTSAERAAQQLLAGWDYSMDQTSAAASVWWTFWSDYLSAVFQPWWTADKVPVSKGRAAVPIVPGGEGSLDSSLDEVLEAWTLGDQQNPAFTAPGGPVRTADIVMRAAFGAAVAHLESTLHGSPAGWAWGRLHSREFPSLLGTKGLGYGPRAAGGDVWTVDSANGGLTSMAGPSWRMIVYWAPKTGTAVGEGIYPGGQSENPASPWYADQIADWWEGKYLLMPPAQGYSSGPVRWVLVPDA
jgi:penicillin G amidase